MSDRTEPVMIKLSVDEMQALERVARGFGMTASEYVLECVVDDGDVQAALRRLPR